MTNSKFKIGDKVKLKPKYVSIFPQTTEIGKVVGLDDDYVLVRYVDCSYKDGFPYRPHEIEHTLRKGQQLIFDFMKGE